MTMKIVPNPAGRLAAPYKDATEKYSGQVRLSSGKRSLLGNVAGVPFPLIDAKRQPGAPILKRPACLLSAVSQQLAG